MVTLLFSFSFSKIVLIEYIPLNGRKHFIFTVDPFWGNAAEKNAETKITCKEHNNIISMHCILRHQMCQIQLPRTKTYEKKNEIIDKINAGDNIGQNIYLKKQSYR